MIGLAEKTETLDEFSKRMAELGEKGLLQGMLRSATRFALKGEGYAKKNATNLLSVRTGRLRSSISGAANLTGGTLEISLQAGGFGAGTGVGGGTVKYAGIQEFGGTVNAKPGKMLRIPFPVAMTKAGVDRYSSPLKNSAPGVFVLVKSKSEKLYLLHRSSGVIWYVLKDSVKIKGKHYLGKAIDRMRKEAPGVFLPIMRSLVLDSSRVAVTGGQ